MVTTNQSTTTNNNISFCLTNSDFSPSSSFNFPSKTEKEPLVYNQMNNLRQKRRERFYVEKIRDIRNRCISSTNNVKTSSYSSEQPLQVFSSFSKISVGQNQKMAFEEENNKYNTLTSSISSPHLPIFVNPLINTQNIIKHLLINKLSFLSIIFFIFSLILPGSATPINTDSQQQTIILPVGSIFILEDNLANELSPRQQLPLWMRADLSNGKKRFFGIPQIRDVGKYQLMFLDGRKSLSLEVTELQPSPCPAGIAPVWLEVLDPREYQRLSMEEQLKLADSILATFHKADVTFVHRENFRIFPYIYLERYRTVTEEILSVPVIPNTSLTALVLNISCGELSEQASEAISVVADNEKGLVFRVVEGTLIKQKVEQKVDATEKIEENKLLKSKDKEASSSSSSFLLIIGIILFLILLLIASILAFRWFKTKQQAKRRKQFLDANSNKNGTTTRPSALNNKENSTKNIPVTALSPDSMKTLTTPMLEGNENCSNEETKIINGNH
uniref:Uncharacterized protein n=1 Tax=Meloidogyne enterolobii TaxID=390850 RepID=A0A6V7U8D6_MELEN|nr:unnamed protein product [Meloidogyne enterolobii]